MNLFKLMVSAHIGTRPLRQSLIIITSNADKCYRLSGDLQNTFKLFS